LATSFNAGYNTYLPWGPFFGVFVKNGTPDDVVTKLSAAYATGAQNADFMALMDNRGFTMMGLNGEEAASFLTKWQQGTAWLMQDAGLTKASPDTFGIARPSN
jgi:tripartite-type tricarboxylate transporter receptor subunit TctC